MNPSMNSIVNHPTTDLTSGAPLVDSWLANRTGLAVALAGRNKKAIVSTTTTPNRFAIWGSSYVIQDTLGEGSVARHLPVLRITSQARIITV